MAWQPIGLWVPVGVPNPTPIRVPARGVYSLPHHPPSCSLIPRQFQASRRRSQPPTPSPHHSKMSSSTTSTSFRTVFGTWRSASTTELDLEAQTITGTRVTIPSLPEPARPRTPESTSDATDPIDDFFGVSPRQRGNQNSRHDTLPQVNLSTSYDETDEVPPPPYAAASELPSYAAVAEPPTLAMYLFKFGFSTSCLPVLSFRQVAYQHYLPVFPLFWFAGILTLLSPLNAPENWEPTKTEAERKELMECLRKTERKWAMRCLLAFMTFAIVVSVIASIAVGVMKS